MFKILILSVALILTACQKKSSDNSAQREVDNSPQSKLGQQMYQQQSQEVTNKGTIEGLWQGATEKSGDSSFTLRVRIGKDKAIAAAKCDFTENGNLVDTLYVGAEGAISYTDKTFTIPESIVKRSAANSHFCGVNIEAATINYQIDASTGIMSLCKEDGSQCNKLTKIAD